MSRKFKRQPGDRFGRLSFVSYTERKPYGNWAALFRCDCGAEKEALVANVTKGAIKSCGCIQAEQRASRVKHVPKWRLKRHEPGNRYGMLELVERIGEPGNLSRKAIFRCDCGTLKSIDVKAVASGATVSCGCYADRRRREVRRTHGKAARAEPHPLYQTWNQMRGRCERPGDPAFRYYGARGIYVCERWQSFKAFAADMGERPSPSHTLDRIDNDGPYSPENCRWATPHQQSNNRRNVKRYRWRGEERTIGEWARILGVRRGALVLRLRRGWSVEDAFTKPINHKHNAWKLGITST